MGNITLGQIGTGLAVLIGIFSGIEFMYSRLKKWLESLIIRELEPVRDDLKKEQAAIESLDVSQSKNFLTRCFDDLENGRHLSGKTDVRMHEVFDHYTNELKQNSYIHDEWEKLKKEGKI